MTGGPTRWWLIASLALNALLLGAILGGGWMLTRAPALPATARLRDAGDRLSAVEQPRFRAMLRQTRIANRALVDRARRARAEAAAALVAQPFDEAALAQALDQARDADLALRRAREAAMVRFAATLSPDDRAALATGLRTTLLRGVARRSRIAEGPTS